MATIPSQETKAVNDLLTAATWNSDVRDSVDFVLSNKPVAMLVQQSAQTGWTTATHTAVTFGSSSETIDNDSQHSTSSNTSRIVIGGTLGWYRVSGLYAAAANSATTLLRASIALNGTRIAGSMGSQSPSSTSSLLAITTGVVYVEATVSTDYVELYGLQSAASGTIGTAVSGTDFASSLVVEYLRKS